MIPTAWLREQAGITEAPQAPAGPDLGELADRIFARLAELFAAPRQGPGQS